MSAAHVSSAILAGLLSIGTILGIGRDQSRERIELNRDEFKLIDLGLPAKCAWRIPIGDLTEFTLNVEDINHPAEEIYLLASGLDRIPIIEFATPTMKFELFTAIRNHVEELAIGIPTYDFVPTATKANYFESLVQGKAH